MKYTHKDLVDLGKEWLVKQKWPVVYTELKTYNNSGEIPDVLGFKSSTSILIECKTSLADFKVDGKKRFRAKPSLGMGNYRYFLIEKDLLKDIELPKDWGLLEINKDKIRIKQKAVYTRNINLHAERSFLYSIIRRIRGDYE
jgi:Holliday junction resolvase